MAAGAKPALESLVEEKKEAVPAALDSTPLTLKDRILRKITQFFEHNERLGPTRQ